MKQQKGFTLIEVMVVVAIIGIISAIAYPSYRENVTRTRRAEARALLTENVQFMEGYFTQNNRFDQDPAGVAVVLRVLTVPRNATATELTYNISLQAVGATTYTLQAVRAAGGTMANDPCGDYTITNTGIRASPNLVSPKTLTECWDR